MRTTPNEDAESLAGVARRGVSDPRVISIAQSLWHAANVATMGEHRAGEKPRDRVERTYAALALAFVQRSVRYQLAIPKYGRETFQEAGRTIEEAAGKCADKAPLLAALFKVVGLKAWIGTSEAGDGGTAHVWVVGHVGGKDEVYDPTALRALPGEHGEDVPRERDGAVLV